MIYFEKLRWKNFLSTGREFTEIDFRESDATLIIGENGSGKSTMLDALTFSLFSKPFRKVNKSQLINSVNKRDCVVEIEFSIGSKSYKVVRGMNPAVFAIYLDGEMLDQDAKMKDYQDRLEKHILKINYKSFTQIIVLGSSTFLPFMKLNSGHRREVIEDLLEIEVFSLMNNILRSRQTENNSHISSNKMDLHLIEEKISVQEKYIREVDEIKSNKIQETESRLWETRNKIIDNEKEVDQIIEKQGFLQNFLEERADLISNFNMLQTYKRDIESNKARVEKEIRSYDNMEFCEICQQKVDENHKHSIVGKKQERIDEYNAGLKDLEEASSTMNNTIQEYDGYREQSEKNEARKRELESEINSSRQFADMLLKDIEYLTKVKDKSGQDREKLNVYQEQKTALTDDGLELRSNRTYLDTASEMLKDTGIKTLIIKQYLPIMNQLINKYLADMDSYFDFHLDENFNETIRANFRDTFSYDSFSEGEKMRIDLALLFTWRSIAKMKNSANTNLLVLDEVFDSSLDTNGIEEFLKIIQGMGQASNIFIISHKGDSLNEKFDNVKRFEKIGNFSKVV